MATQKAKTTELVQLSSDKLTSSEAQKLLRQYGWDVEAASNAYFDDEDSYAKTFNKKKKSNPNSDAQNKKVLESLFKKYTSENETENETDFDGTKAYFDDLELNPDGPDFLVISHFLKSPAMGVLEKDSFVSAWLPTGYTTIQEQKDYAKHLVKQISQDVDNFKSVYKFAFGWIKEQSSRVVPASNAQPIVQQLLFPNAPQDLFEPHSAFRDPQSRDSWLQKWFDFVGSKPISKDVWMQFIDFVATLDEKCEKHDPYAAWPTLMDDFVEHVTKSS